MSFLDIILLVVPLGYCVYVLLGKKKRGCCGNCSGCQGCAQKCCKNTH